MTANPTLYTQVRSTAWRDDRHIYLSTSCLHGIHSHCTASMRFDGAGGKAPSVCKWCPADCVCLCHGEPGIEPAGLARVSTARETSLPEIYAGLYDLLRAYKHRHRLSAAEMALGVSQFGMGEVALLVRLECEGQPE